jgi:hypothetical protein
MKKTLASVGSAALLLAVVLVLTPAAGAHGGVPGSDRGPAISTTCTGCEPNCGAPCLLADAAAIDGVCAFQCAQNHPTQPMDAALPGTFVIPLVAPLFPDRTGPPTRERFSVGIRLAFHYAPLLYLLQRLLL